MLPRKIIAFGSWAKDETTPDSDIDFLFGESHLSLDISTPSIVLCHHLVYHITLYYIMT
ncbi:MAG: nucleotidyltransferase domain-containing protein [Patescibacteria group bacterium]